MKIRDIKKELKCKNAHWEITVNCFNEEENRIDHLDECGSYDYFICTKEELNELYEILKLIVEENND